MTPKEKAIELYQKYETLGRDFTRGVSMKEHAKQSALMAVNEIIRNIPKGFYSGIRPDYKGTDLEYWQEVKQQIELL